MGGGYKNAYLQAPWSETYDIIYEIEWVTGSVGRKVIIDSALYGPKTSGVDFRNHLRDCMQYIGYIVCLEDDDVWRWETVSSIGNERWGYILLHTNACLVISKFGGELLIKKYNRIKRQKK